MQDQDIEQLRRKLQSRIKQRSDRIAGFKRCFVKAAHEDQKLDKSLMALIVQTQRQLKTKEKQ